MIFYSQYSRVILDTVVDDNSYRHRAVMGDHNITLHYSLAEHVELPVGAYCLYDGQRYTLERPEAFTMKHSRDFEYTVTMESVEAKAKIYKFRNPVGGSSIYACDYHNTNIPTAETLRGVLCGGAAINGSGDGFASANSTGVPSVTGTSIGSRLCFIPE